MNELLKAIFKPMEAKDPNDGMLTASSTPWEEDECCDNCLKKIQSSFHTEGYCDNCGQWLSWGSGSNQTFRRLTRKIWNGTKWRFQMKLRNSTQIVDFSPSQGKPRFDFMKGVD